MKEARYFYVPEAATAAELPAEEATHATRVLRLQPGDEMFLMDGKGCFYRAAVTLATSKRCMYEIKETLPQDKTWNGHIHIAVAPTKMMERIEWFAEKATEVGVDEFSFLSCKFSERKVMKEERIDKIVVSATKQSRKAFKPIVNPLATFKEFISQERSGKKFIAHCYTEIDSVDLFNTLSQTHSADAATDVTVLIGPEGDFSIDEVRLAIECGYTPISLGESRLRTETAALYAAMIAQTVMRRKG